MQNICNQERNKVYVLWFVREQSEGADIEILIGVYENEIDAKFAIERLRAKPGFADFPKGFHIDSYDLGRDHWTEGFVQDAGGCRRP